MGSEGSLGVSSATLTLGLLQVCPFSGSWDGFGNLAEPFAGSRLRDRRYDDNPQLFESHLARILVSFRQAASHHLATFTLKVTVLAPPAFLMTNLYCPSFFGVTLTEHFGRGESSLATSAPEES